MDECSRINQNLRDICRCERAGQTLDQCNRRRVAWGIPPLDAMPGSEPQDDPKPLNTAERIRSFAGVTAQTVWRFLVHNESMLTEEEMQPRLDKCNACPHLVNSHCNLCGCSCVRENKPKFLQKIAHRSASCPDDPPRWGPL